MRPTRSQLAFQCKEPEFLRKKFDIIEKQELGVGRSERRERMADHHQHNYPQGPQAELDIRLERLLVGPVVMRER